MLTVYLANKRRRAAPKKPAAAGTRKYTICLAYAQLTLSGRSGRNQAAGGENEA
jgi:hypothetical protein